MGDEMPEEQRWYDPNKWYLSTVDCFDGPTGTGCGRPWTMECRQCIQGDVINDWFANDSDCKDWRILNDTCYAMAQRSLSISGPFDTRTDCLLAM